MAYILVIIAVICWFLYGSDNKHEKYDRGYESAWEGVELSKFSGKEVKKGYEDGLDDLWAYDSGYDDGYDKKAPKYFNDAFYMDGYKDGKADRKK